MPVWQDQVLLCRRAIEPRKGLWTLPAGFMENGETTLQGAIRETREEAGAELTLSEQCLYAMYNLPAINQVYVFFRAELANLNFHPGPESLEVQLFREEDIPWQDIAFAVVKHTLKNYFADRQQQVYPVRMYDVSYSAESGVTLTMVSQSR